MFPLIGRTVYVDYDTAKFNIQYVDANILKFDGSIGETISKEIVEYRTVLVDKGVYMVYWFEPASKMFVTQVMNLNNFRVYSNVVSLVTTEFMHLKGRMTVMKEDKTQAPPSNN